MWRIARKAQDETDSLKHHGILGQKWGIRRFQNPDGSLKPAERSGIRAHLMRELYQRTQRFIASQIIKKTQYTIEKSMFR